MWGGKLDAGGDVDVGKILMGEKILTVKCDEGFFWVGVGKASFATGLKYGVYSADSTIDLFRSMI